MKKVLIVEDDEDIVHALSIRLEAAGYQVVKAYDVVLGTSAIVRELPDIAILDVSMPGGNGIMLAERIREIPETADTPLIFLTASKKPEIRERAMGIGAVAFIEKPYEAVEVLKLVDETLKISKAG